MSRAIDAVRRISRVYIIFIKTWRLSRREADDGPATKATKAYEEGTRKIVYADQPFSIMHANRTKRCKRIRRRRINGRGRKAIDLDFCKNRLAKFRLDRKSVV